eukprot:tig00020685_g12924.t1
MRSDVAAGAAGALAAAVAAAAVWWRNKIERVRDRKSDGTPMPGPKPTLFLGNLPTLMKGTGTVSVMAPEWRREHGDIVQLLLFGMPVVLVLEHELARKVLNTPERPVAPITTLASWGGRGIIFSEGDFQRRHRRFVVGIMGERLYRAVAEASLHYAQRDLFPAFDAACESGAEIDPRVPLTTLTACVLMKTCFSVDLLPGSVLPGGITAERFGEAFAELLDWVGQYFKIPFQFWKVFRPPGFRVLERAMADVAACERAVLADRLAARAAGAGRQEDFVDALLDAFEGEPGLSLEDLRVDVHDLLMAGHDTTRSALAFTLALLARWPAAQAELRGEVDGALGGRPPSFEGQRALALLECAMKETLRLYPAAPSVFRVAPPGGMRLGEYTLPEGRWLQVSLHQLHRDPAVFPEPARYDPRRFLGPDEARDRAWMPFGGGPRLCAGKAFSAHEFRTVLACLLQRYEVLPAGAGAAPPEPLFGTTLHPRADVAVRLRRRQ